MIGYDLVSELIHKKAPSCKPAQYTSKQSKSMLREVLKLFSEGEIRCLAAIRCLDEGVDIPACRTAIIMSSSADPRQSIQRRGRVLRVSEGKEYAKIYDFVVKVPKNNIDLFSSELFESEIRRVNSFARDSLNPEHTKEKLGKILNYYSFLLDE